MTRVGAVASSDTAAAVATVFPVHRVAIFAATSWEVEAVLAAGPHAERTRLAGIPAAVFPCGEAWCYVIKTGVGPDRAREVAAAVLTDAKWDRALSTGFAGALAPAHIGSLVIGRDVAAVPAASHRGLATGVFSCDPSFQQMAPRPASGTQVDVLRGLVISTAYVVGQAKEKQALAELYGAVAVDMESAAIAEVAFHHQIPFGVIRTVSDRVDESMPVDFNWFVRTTGRAGGRGRSFAACLFHPSAWLGLLRLSRHSRIAARQLTHSLWEFLTQLTACRQVSRGA